MDRWVDGWLDEWMGRWIDVTDADIVQWKGLPNQSKKHQVDKSLNESKSFRLSESRFPHL